MDGTYSTNMGISRRGGHSFRIFYVRAELRILTGKTHSEIVKLELLRNVWIWMFV